MRDPAMSDAKHPGLKPHAHFDEGFLRLSEILAPKGPIPVSRSTWWAGVQQGHFPAPVKIGKRVTAWRRSDIAQLIAKLAQKST
jgi:prophage regulatory protein